MVNYIPILIAQRVTSEFNEFNYARRSVLLATNVNDNISDKCRIVSFEFRSQICTIPLPFLRAIFFMKKIQSE